MRAAAVTLGVVASLLLPGCAGHGWQRHFDRWQALQDKGPYTPWARCIDETSRGYLASTGATRRPAWSGTDQTEDPRIFTWILADCGHLMKGGVWRLPPEKIRDLIDEAYRHFLQVEIEIRSLEEEAIV